jgi:hypothetical protein
MKKQLILVTVVLISFCSFSCGLSANNIQGRYVAEHGELKEYVEIYVFGNYKHYVIKKRDTIQKQVGRWEIDGKPFAERVVFFDFIQYFDMISGNKIKPSDVILDTYCDGRQIGGYDTPEYKYFRVAK